MFGPLIDADEDVVQLLAELDTLLDTPRFYLNKTQRNMPEMQHVSGHDLAMQLLAFPPLATDNLEAWLDVVGQFVHPLDSKGEPGRLQWQLCGFPLLRRMITAQLVRAWATTLNRTVPSGAEARLMTLFSEVCGVILLGHACNNSIVLCCATCLCNLHAAEHSHVWLTWNAWTACIRAHARP